MKQGGPNIYLLLGLAILGWAVAIGVRSCGLAVVDTII
jgi:hypothetical protein